MTRFEMIKSLDRTDMSLFLCDLFDKDCNNCPATKICKIGINGMDEWLNEEVTYAQLTDDIRKENE